MEYALIGRKRPAAWRHRGAAWCLIAGGWTIEPSGIALFMCARTLARFAGTELQAVVEAAWNAPAGRTWAGGFVQRVRSLFERVGFAVPTPWSATFGTEGIHWPSAAPALRDHFLRETWRACVMKEANRQQLRHIPIRISSLDVKPLRVIMDDAPSRDRLLVWRCLVAAEPNRERLAHIDPTVPDICPECGVKGTSLHMLYECPVAAPLRAQFQVDLALMDSFWHDIADSDGINAWRLNGWLPAAHAATYAPALRQRQLTMIPRFIKFKVEVFRLGSSGTG